MKKSLWIILLLVGILFSLYSSDDLVSSTSPNVTPAVFDINLLNPSKQYVKIVSSNAYVPGDISEAHFLELDSASGNSQTISTYGETQLDYKLAVYCNELESYPVDGSMVERKGTILVDVLCTSLIGQSTGRVLPYTFRIATFPDPIPSGELVARRFEITYEKYAPGANATAFSLYINIPEDGFKAASEDIYESNIQISMVSK